MAPYVYSKLNTKIPEIGILTLLPGSLKDPISFTISHEKFDIPDFDPHPPSAITPEHRNGLPAGWDVGETAEGEIIYNYDDPETGDEYCTWTHPDPSFCLRGIKVRRDVPENKTPSYEALSYAWGTAKSLEPAFVSDYSTRIQTNTGSSGTLQLGENLICALKHLRYPEKTRRRLWIDAICINQQDLDERGSQVQLMAKIYKFAERVVVWLGPEQENTKLAISTMQYLGRQVEIFRTNSYVPSPNCKEVTWFSPEVVLPYDDQTYQSISNMLERSWFDRVWIIQEIQLAKPNAIMLCGAQEILWSLFRRGMVCMLTKTSIPGTLRERLRAVWWRTARCLNNDSPTLNSLFRATVTAKCVEPVDKVHGILGIGPRMLTKKIIPDYTVYYGEVYKTIFLQHLALSRRFELLGWCSLQSVPKMPTWVPNFLSTKNSFALARGGSYYASGFSSASFSEQNDTLKVEGVRVTKVSTVHKSSVNSLSDLFDIVPDVKLSQSENKLYVTGESLLDALASALSCCALRDRFPRDGLTKLYRKELASLIMTTTGSVEKVASAQTHFRLFNRVKGLKFITTEDGHFGFGPDVLPGNLEYCMPENVLTC